MAEIQVVYVDSGDCGICGNGLWGGPLCVHKLATDDGVPLKRVRDALSELDEAHRIASRKLSARQSLSSIATRPRRQEERQHD